MDDEAATARGLFQFYYQGVDLIRMVQHGRSDPDNVRALIREAATSAKNKFPQHASALDEAAAEYEAAIGRGLELKATHPG